MLWGGSDAEKKFLREMNKCIQWIQKFQHHALWRKRI
jgi:hypothetical protein